MNIGATKSWPAGLWMIGLLILAGLACAQAGEVLTPEEATERARSPVTSPDTTEDFGGDFEVGDTATLTGRSFLVNLLDAPGGSISAGQQRGAEVTIEQVAEEEGELWYLIDAPGGTGWVSRENLELIEGEEAAEGEQPEGEQAEDGTGDVAVGDTVILVGTSFLVNFYDEPGPNARIIAGQQRNSQVTVLEVSQQDGTLWYLIDSDAGQGWVPAENISTEAP